MTLTDAQFNAATTLAPKVLCIAGAGSGKTRTLVERIRNALAAGADPNKVVVITFTNAAARELEGRLRSGEQVAPLGYCGTLHGYALRFIKQAGEAIGYGRTLSVITQEQSEQIIEAVVAELKWRGTNDEVDAALKLGAYVTRRNSNRRSLTKGEVVAQAYFRRLREGQMLDFDGILHAGLELLAMHGKQPDPLPTHLFVDEYQDSGDLDAEFYELVGATHKFVVGDPDQSIYGFRGGNVGNIVALARPGSGFEVHVLEENFRCGSAICDAAQRLVECNTGRPDKRTVSATGSVGQVGAGDYDNAMGERSGVAAMVGEALNSGIPASELAVLCRTNKLAKDFAMAFEAAGIQVATRRRAEKPNDWHRVTAFVSLLANPDNDTLALFHVEHSQGRVERMAAQMAALEAMQSVNEAVLHLPYDTKPGDVAAMASRSGVGGREALDELERVVASLPANAGLGDLAFALRREEFTEPEIGCGVTVTTMHAAKGREWGCVWLPGFEQGICPQARKDTNLEEERRLAYVAFTRAKQRLTLSYCRERLNPWTKKPEACEPSQFIGEAGL